MRSGVGIKYERCMCASILIGALALVAIGRAECQEWIYTARPGDNLWALSKQHLKRVTYWRELQTLNNIQNPRQIPPGTRIRVPIAWLRKQPAQALATDVRGQVERTPARSTRSEALRSGTSLRIGDRIRTDADSSVTLEFADGSRLLVHDESELTLDTMSAYGETGMVDTQVRLRGGRGESDVLPAQGPATRYQITTPAAVAAVRGTSFRVSVDTPSGTSRSEALDGEIAVQGGGLTRIVPAGFGVLTEEGRTPSPPKQLLPPPDRSKLPRVIDRLLLSFQWPAVTGATGYRAQVFAATSFDNFLLNKVVEEPRVEWNALPDDDYVLRLRGIDELGLEGIDGDHRFTINARPEPPALLEPIAGALLYDEPPNFWWSIPEGVVTFHLQVATDPAFNNLALELPEHSQSRFRPDELTPGEYFWRIASKDERGEKGPFGDALAFRILAVPEPPATDAPDIESKQLRFSWPPVMDAVQYQFQFARDEEFSDVLVDEVVTDPEITIERPFAGQYYFRARGQSSEGVDGPFSNVNRVDIPLDNHWPLLLVPLPLLFLLL